MHWWKQYKQLVEANAQEGEDQEIKKLCYWRNKLFAKMMLVLLPTCLVALIPGVIMSVKGGIPLLAIYDILAASAIGFITFNRKLGLQTRKALLLLILYLLAFMLLLFLGSMGPGLIYLFALTIFTTLIFNVSIGYLSCAINTVIIIISGVCIHFNIVDSPLNYYDVSAWMAVSSNLIFISILSTASLDIILKGLEGTIFKANELHERATESEKLYKQLFDKNPLPLIIHDHDTFEFLLVNEAAINTYGYTREEFYKMTIMDIRKPGQEKTIKSHLATNGNFKIPGELEHVCKNKKIITVEIQSDVITFLNRKARLATILNVTERNRDHEQIRTQNKQLREIAFLTSHGLRAPLANILGLVNILDRDDFCNPDNKPLINFIYSSSLQVDKIIREIVDQTALLGNENDLGIINKD
jgi:PAS domain S-box-containing protein